MVVVNNPGEMLFYIAICFCIMSYLMIYRQKDEPILLLFVLITAIPMFAEFWELAIFYLAFFTYRAMVQIRQKID